MKKICFVNYDMSIIGGAEQVTATLANVLCKEYLVYVYSINDCGEIAYKLDEKVTYIKKLKNANRLREMMLGTFKPFCDLVKREKIDTVVMMGNYPALIVSLCRFFTKAKYIYCDHGALMNQWHQKSITLIRYWDALVSHKTITLTEKTREDYIDKFHISSDKVKCIYNWISPEILKVKKDYDIHSKKILSVGRFGKEKGHDLLVKVAKQVLPKHPDWEWHVYGTGEEFENISHKVQENNLCNQLILKGNVPEVYKKYSEYSILVLTSYREGLPLVLLEANALGIPMVSFNIITGPNEIIVDGDNGFLIEPYDCEKMAESINELIENEDMRLAQSQNTKKYNSKFSCETIFNEWRKIL